MGAAGQQRKAVVTGSAGTAHTDGNVRRGRLPQAAAAASHAGGICATMFSDVNHLAMVVGESAADGQTWQRAQWVRDSHAYATHRLLVAPEWMQAAQAPLARPEWDAGDIIDMDAAGRAQAAIILWNGAGDMPMPQQGKIVCVPGVLLRAAIEAWGLELRQPININEADAETLESLPGVSAARAQAIIAGGPWADPFDMAQISGISTAMIEGWQAHRNHPVGLAVTHKSGAAN